MQCHRPLRARVARPSPLLPPLDPRPGRSPSAAARRPRPPALGALVLLLLAGVARADDIPEVANTRFVGVPVAVAPIATGDAYLPAVLTQRSDPRGHWRSIRMDGEALDQAKLSGDARGMARHGGGVVVAYQRGTTLEFLEMRYEARLGRSVEHGSLEVGDYKDLRVLRMASLPDAPLVVLGHAGGLVVASIEPRGRGRTDLIARPGRTYTAVTEPFHADRDQRLDMFAAGLDGYLLRLRQDGAGFRALSEEQWQANGFEPRAVAGLNGQLLLGGTRAGRAFLVGFGAFAGLPRRVRKDDAEPQVQLDFGRGSIDQLAFLDRDRVVVGGALQGRSWIAVVERGPRPRVVHETYLPGTGVLALATNPARVGWSIAAGTRDNTFHLLRVPEDTPKPRDWDPFAGAEPAPPVDVPDGGPVPEPAPVPDAPAGGVPPGTPSANGGLTTAILPRVEADARAGVDTQLVFVSLDERPVEVTVRYVRDDGNVVHTDRVTLHGGQRARLSVAEALLRQRVLDFDGYVVVGGAERRSLVLEGLVRRRGSVPEVVAAHWR